MFIGHPPPQAEPLKALSICAAGALKPFSGRGGSESLQELGADTPQASIGRGTAKRGSKGHGPKYCNCSRPSSFPIQHPGLPSPSLTEA